MKYQKEPSQAQNESMLQALRCAMQHGNNFFVMADLNNNALTAGSSRMPLVEFMVNCMMADSETAELLLNAVMNFISNKILQDVCGNCDKSENCHKKQNHCDPENLFGDIKSQLEVAMKLMKFGKN